MPGNNFEKQVQQRMDELQLRPSAEVWEEVEKRIRKEKKRRRFILWFFLFGALSLGGAAWWAMDNNKKQTPPGNPVVQITDDKKINEIATDKKDNTKNEPVSEEQIKDSNENKNKKTEVQSINNPVITKEEVVPDKKIPVAAQIKKPGKKEKITINSVPSLAKKKGGDKTKTSLPAVINNDQPMIAEKKDKADSITSSGEIVNTDVNTRIKNPVAADKNIVTNDPVSSKQEITPEIKDSLIAKQAEPVSKKDSSKAKKNKWEFGVTAMAGTSHRSDGISIFDSQKSFDAFALNGNPGGSATQTVTTVAGPQKNFSWQIGFYAKRKLTKRTGFSAGLNFSSYSTIQQTGAFVDSSRIYNNRLYSSSVSNFYRNGTVADYNNHYYYLQLPLSFHWQINKGIKLPLVWQNGFSASFLTGSDALVYDSGSNVFYHDNKLLYKTQVAFQSGLYIKLFNKSKNPLTAGVLYNYHFSKLEKVNLSGSNHLSSFGVQLGWLLPLSPKGGLRFDKH
jgi:hypothetical protein